MSTSAIITMIIVQLTVTFITGRFLLRTLKKEDSRRFPSEHNGQQP